MRFVQRHFYLRFHCALSRDSGLLEDIRRPGVLVYFETADLNFEPRIAMEDAAFLLSEDNGAVEIK